MHRVAKKAVAPVESFLHTEASGGILLLGAAVIALIWANVSPHSYHSVWHAKIALGMGVGGFEPMTMGLQHWINDGLMTIFFMVVGFEIKRELVEGELSDVKRATLPIAAAIGGMFVPAGIYLALNSSGDGVHGWGIPMATDIAFAVGILLLMGKRVPAAMRILLLALAIIDDLGAILVIALFYTEQLSFLHLGLAGGGLLVLFGYRKLGIRPGSAYIVPLFIMWIGLYYAGVHPTIAGVLAGILAPVKPWLDRETFLKIADSSLAKYRAEEEHPHRMVVPLYSLGTAAREATSPVSRLENKFHPLVAYFIMPLFALANAGVYLGDVDFSGGSSLAVAGGITLGLAVGKPLGVLGLTWIFVKLGLCTLPKGITFGGITVLGCLAGIGFTMSIFIGGLAFPGHPEYLSVAKIAILAATAISAIAGIVLGMWTFRKPLAPDVAKVTAAEAETSTDY